MSAAHASPDIVGRPDRSQRASDELVLRPPPPLERSEGSSGVLMNALPMLGSLGSILLVATAGGSGQTGRQYLSAGLFLFATVGFVVVQIDRQRTRKQHGMAARRAGYLRYLDTVRDTVRGAAAQQRRALGWHHPPPTSLPALAAEGSRVWERGPSDPRFLQVRYGVSDQPLALRLVPPETAPDSAEVADPVAAAALRRLLSVHRVQPGLPDTLDLRAAARIQLTGSEEQARSTARALVCSATAFHAPRNLLVAVLTTEEGRVHWDWLKWLPHAHSTRATDALGRQRLVATTRADLAALLPADLMDRPRFGADERPLTPHVLVIVDDVPLPADDPLLPASGRNGVTVLDLSALDAPPLGAGMLWLGPEGRDACDLQVAEAFARRLAPLRGAVPGPAPQAHGGGATDLMALLEIGDPRALDPAVSWRPRPACARLRVPIGTDEDGAPVHLDLKEAAQQGMGPHGLVIGATGSGKSELLRTLVVGLAVSHPPDQVNFVLVDFKGGATFAGMADLPHVSAVITNLATDLALVDRMHDALSGELVRRQELLRAAGNLASLEDYERARASRSRTGSGPLPALPSLLVVVDEFAEMLSAKPEFLDLFVAIGRLGRSLGLHLLLASQRLEEGRLRGLESHLSYRIGLRTFSALDSRAVLGVPDAYELPTVPGLGYLKTDATSMVRFQGAYVSGPPPRTSPAEAVEVGAVAGILPFTVAPLRAVRRSEPPPPTREASQRQRRDQSVLDLAVARLAGHGRPAHRIWLPPLDVPETLDGLLPDLTADTGAGLLSPSRRASGGLVIPLGTLDQPRAQRRDPLHVDLSGAAGHVAIVGGPRSGKSTLLRTLVCSLALTATPLETQVFVLDFGGGTFTPLSRLPHIAGLATRSEPEVARRVVAEARAVVDRREAYFRTAGIDSIETYRAWRREGRADDGHGDVFVVVDGWASLRADFDDLDSELQQLAQRGLTFGFHLVTAATRWADYRPTLRDLLGTRLELGLGEPSDSEIDRKQASMVPRDRPGRGLVAQGLHFLAALPRIDGDPRAETLAEGTADLVRRVRAAWTGPAGPKLKMLPERVTLEEVRAAAGVGSATPGSALLLGLGERDLAPVALDPDAEPHLLVFGDGGSGKSTVLRSYAHEVMRLRTPDQAQLVVVDYRRALLGDVGEEYLLHYLTSASPATTALRELAAYLQGRLPGPDVTPAQLRARSWWVGAEVFVLVDDYDLVATQQGSPVAVLQPLLAHAHDIGLHLVLARRTGGAARSLYEPVIQTLRDLASPGLVLSGDPAEGQLVGNVRAVPARPGRGRLVTRAGGAQVVQTAWRTAAPDSP